MDAACASPPSPGRWFVSSYFLRCNFEAPSEASMLLRCHNSPLVVSSFSASFHAPFRSVIKRGRKKKEKKRNEALNDDKGSRDNPGPNESYAPRWDAIKIRFNPLPPPFRRSSALGCRILRLILYQNSSGDFFLNALYRRHIPRWFTQQERPIYI